jgi:hypothetical protein
MAQLKIKAQIPVFNGKVESFNKWRVEFKSYLHLQRFSYLLDLPTNKSEVKLEPQPEVRKLKNDAEAIKDDEERKTDAERRWKEQSADVYALLPLALDDKTKTFIANALSFKMNRPQAWKMVKDYFKSRSIVKLC